MHAVKRSAQKRYYNVFMLPEMGWCILFCNSYIVSACYDVKIKRLCSETFVEKMI